MGLVVVYILIVLYSPVHALLDGDVVHTRAGSLRGKIESLPLGRFVRQFLGIPYAVPPIGNLRFSRPQPVATWRGVKDAVKYGANCPQPSMPYPVNFTLAGEEKEDCLYLNVYAPVNSAAGHKLAVLVWIHGGFFVSESGRAYDGSVLAAFNDVIFVTMNYRLGVLGFFNIPGTDVSGNYALFDQLLALRWVNDNIEQFGGDSQCITILGHSAGARSASLLTLSPLAKGLYQRAIIMSGAPLRSVFCHCDKVTDTTALEIMTRILHCPSLGKNDILECLRGKTVNQIIEAQKAVSFPSYTGSPVLTSAVVDGELVSDTPKRMLDTGDFSGVEIMTGVTANESSLFPASVLQDFALGGVPRDLFESVIRRTIFSKYNNDIIVAAVLYKYTNHSDPHSPIANRDNWIAMLTEGMMIAPTDYMARAYHHGNATVYFYVFSHVSRFSVFPEYVGVAHGSE